MTDTQARFLEAYLDCFNLTRAAEVTGITRQTHYNAMSYHPGYRDAYNSLRRTQFTDELISKMAERSTKGAQRVDAKGQPVFDAEGNPVMTYDTILQIYMSKAIGGLSDQTRVEREATTGPNIHIYLPEQSTSVVQPVIEINSSDEVDEVE